MKYYFPPVSCSHMVNFPLESGKYDLQTSDVSVLSLLARHL